MTNSYLLNQNILETEVTHMFAKPTWLLTEEGVRAWCLSSCTELGGSRVCWGDSTGMAGSQGGTDGGCPGRGEGPMDGGLMGGTLESPPAIWWGVDEEGWRGVLRRETSPSQWILGGFNTSSSSHLTFPVASFSRVHSDTGVTKRS